MFRENRKCDCVRNFAVQIVIVLINFAKSFLIHLFCLFVCLFVFQFFWKIIFGEFIRFTELIRERQLDFYTWKSSYLIQGLSPEITPKGFLLKVKKRIARSTLVIIEITLKNNINWLLSDAHAELDWFVQKNLSIKRINKFWTTVLGHHEWFF